MFLLKKAISILFNSLVTDCLLTKIKNIHLFVNCSCYFERETQGCGEFVGANLCVCSKEKRKDAGKDKLSDAEPCHAKYA